MTLKEVETRVIELEAQIKRLDQRIRTLRHEALNPKYREKVVLTKRDQYNKRKKQGLCVKCGAKALIKKDGTPSVLCKKHKR